MNRYVLSAVPFGHSINTQCIYKEKRMNNYEVRQIRNLGEADPFILDIHYAKRKPSISYIYGLFENGES